MWLVAYGEDDSAAKLLVLSEADVAAALRPVEELRPESYRFCAMHVAEGEGEGGQPGC